MAAARTWLSFQLRRHRHRFSGKPFPFYYYSTSNRKQFIENVEDDDDDVGCKPISHILKDLNKKLPESLLRLRTDPPHAKFIPWHTLNRILNLQAPEWSGEVRSITYSADGKFVSVVYRVTLYGTDAEVFRESTGTAPASGGYGDDDAVQKAEAMAFRRACARLGLGLHLYHQDLD